MPPGAVNASEPTPVALMYGLPDRGGEGRNESGKELNNFGETSIRRGAPPRCFLTIYPSHTEKRRDVSGIVHAHVHAGRAGYEAVGLQRVGPRSILDRRRAPARRQVECLGAEFTQKPNLTLSSAQTHQVEHGNVPEARRGQERVGGLAPRKNVVYDQRPAC